MKESKEQIENKYSNSINSLYNSFIPNTYKEYQSRENMRAEIDELYIDTYGYAPNYIGIDCIKNHKVGNEMNLEKTLEERGKEYGEFISQAKLAQNLKGMVREHPMWFNCDSDMRESIDMILHKIARVVNGNPYNIDNWHDISGYATLVEKRVSKNDDK